MVYTSKIFSIDPDIEKRIHPEALRILTDWENLELLTLPTNLTAVEAYSYLNENKKAKFKACIDEILEGLKTCVDVADGVTLYDVYVGDIFIKRGIISEFQRTSQLPLFSLKLLLRKACDQKLEKEKREAEEARKKKMKEEEQKRREVARAEEEVRKREEQAEAERKEKEETDRWCDAYLALKPPDNDARKYLDDKEYEKFERATWKAVDIYIEKGEEYLDDSRSLDYRHWLWVINNMKEEEQIHNDAQAQAQAFGTRLDQGLKKIRNLLSVRKADPASFFKSWCSNNGENRYLDESFTDILARGDEKNRNWKQGYIPAAEEELRKSIPGELRNFVLIKSTAAFFLLPSANYSYCGLPCLDFYFTVFAVVTITVSAQAGWKEFNGYKFDFLTNLQEPEQLGFYQITITSNEPHFWQSMPLTMIGALFEGNPQLPNATILERTDRLAVYEVQKFEEDICEIPISFERYCRNLGSIEKMKEVKIINERTVEILEPLGAISINHKESKSKKAQAFVLFDKGKRPSDPELQALGLKPETLYRYFQEWKKINLNS